jgi:hypothetical protein
LFAGQDKKADLRVRLADAPPDEFRSMQCRTSNVTEGTGLKAYAIDKFAGVLYVFLNATTSTFHVLMPEDYVPPKPSGWQTWDNPNEEPAIRYTPGDAASEKAAYRALL